MISAVLLACIGVIVGPGWSDPILVTDSENTKRRVQFIHRDTQGRFHLVWAGFNDEHRIAYKMFNLDGSTVYPETMISRDVNSLYLSTIEMNDSLYAFWRESNPVYTAARSLSDGGEILPATYLFTNLTYRGQIRSSPDSLGRLHVLYNGGEGACPLYYAVWSPSPDSGFTTEYEWRIEGVDDRGEILVDGNRVHIVAKDSLVLDYVYLQYDLEGNTVVPLTDVTTPDDILECGGYLPLQVDSDGNLLIVEHARIDEVEGIYYWKIDGETGEVLIGEYLLVPHELPEMDTRNGLVLEPTHISNHYHLCWNGYYAENGNKIYHLVFDSDGNIIHDWQLAYDFSDEEPEDVQNLDGVSDEEGNLFIVFAQVETEPQVAYFPTFGWLDYSTLGMEDETFEASSAVGFSVSQNPVTGSVAVLLQESSDSVLHVYDLTGRVVSTINVSDGIGVWDGTDQSGNNLPLGTYTISGPSGYSHLVTLLNR